MSKKNPKNESKDPSTPLAKYERNKKMLTPPLASLPGMALTSWTNNRMPDMLWAVLIREHHPGDAGYAIFRNVLDWLMANKGDSEVGGVTHTDIAGFDEDVKKGFIRHVVEMAGTDALKPLLLLADLPSYVNWKEAIGEIELDHDNACSQLASAISDVMFHQTQEATDVRWVKLMGTILGGKLHMPTEMLDKYLEYPNKYDQRSVRPSIRSAEMTTEMVKDSGVLIRNEWSEKFWRFLQENTTCIPEVSVRKEDILNKYEDENEDKKHFNAILPNIRESLILHFLNTSVTTGIDARHETSFGLALYALDVFIENVILKVGGTSSGRVNARIIFECYITMKYLLEKEKSSELLWDAYREYGIGQVSLTDRKYKEGGYNTAMVDTQITDSIANEDKWQEYVPINLGHWDATDLRTSSTAIGEKDLYDQYYTYTSGFIHASWGAVREASFQRCLNPLHRLHRIPLFGLPVLSGVNEDCRQMMNKILGLVDELYPEFKYSIVKRSATTKEDKKLDSNRTATTGLGMDNNEDNRT